MINKLKRIFSNQFWVDTGITTVGQVVVILLTFLLNKIISSSLGPAMYTNYSLITKSAGIFAFAMELCMGIAVPRYLSIYIANHDKEREKTCAVVSITLVSIVTVILCFLMLTLKAFLANLIFGSSEYSDYIVPVILFAVKTAYTTYLYSFLRGMGKFIHFSVYQIFIDTVGLIVAFCFKDLIPLVIVLSILQTLLSWLLIAWMFLRRYPSYGVTVKNCAKRETRELLVFSLPRVPGEVILFSFTSVPLMIINRKIGATETAGFTIALGILSAFTPLFKYIGMVLLPYASKSIAKKQMSGLKHRMVQFGIMYLIFSAFSILVMFLFPELIIRILYSSEYLQFIPTVQAVIFSIIPMSMYLLLRNPLDAATKIPINTINLAVSFVCMNLIIVLSTSKTAYAIAFIAGYFVLGLLSVISWLTVCRMQERKQHYGEG